MITADQESREKPAPGDTQCIELSGADARAFAQAQFSGNLERLRPGTWQWNAWLDANGSVRALMHLACLDGDGSGGERLLVLLRGGDAQAACAALRRFVLRAKVSLNVLSGLRRTAGAALPFGEIEVESGAIGFGYGDRGLWLKTNATAIEPALEHEARLADIRAGWPTLPPGGGHVFLPPALGLEHLAAVSFDKGCYPGQEIAARLHYRGGHKLRLCHVRADFPLTAGQPPLPSLPRAIVLDALQTAHGFEALAVLDESAVNDGIVDAQRSALEIVQRFEA